MSQTLPISHRSDRIEPNLKPDLTARVDALGCDFLNFYNFRMFFLKSELAGSWLHLQIQ